MKPLIAIAMLLCAGCAGTGTYYGTSAVADGDLDAPAPIPEPYDPPPLPVPYTVNVGEMGEPYHQVTVWPY